MRLVRAGAGATASRIALVCVSAAFLAASCHVPGTGGSRSATTGSGSITVAAVPGIDNAPLQVAIQNGLFRQQGLSVTIQRYSSVGQEIAALNSGHAQIAVGDYTDFFYAQYKGTAKLSLIADGYDATANSIAILTLPTSGISSPQQLQGLTVASPPPLQGIPDQHRLPYNMPTLASEQVLQSDGLSPTSVSWSPTPIGNMIRTLRSNPRVKAILVTEPYIFEAEKQLGAVEVVDSTNGVTGNLPLSGYFSLASYAKQQTANVQAFQAALSQAQSDATMGGQVQTMLPRYTGMSQQDAAMATVGTYPTTLSVGQVQRVLQLMVDSGMIANPTFSVSDLVFRP